MLVDGEHEAILSVEVFSAAQDAVEAHVRRYKGSTGISQREEVGTMLQGLVKCSSCGGTLSRSGKGMNCVRYIHGKCKSSHYITLTKLEDLILTAIESQMNNLQAEIVRRTLPVLADQTAMLEQQLKREETILEKCKEAYLAGVDTIEEYRENKAASQARIERIRSLLAEQKTPKPVDVKAFAERNRPVVAMLRDKKLSEAEKNKLLRSFVDHIVFDNKTKTVIIVYYE